MTEWKTLDEFKDELFKDANFRARFQESDHEFTIAREILAARRAAGMSQESLAAAIGTSQSRVSKWERGEEMPRIEALYKIAQATGTIAEVALVSGEKRRSADHVEEGRKKVRIPSTRP